MVKCIVWDLDDTLWQGTLGDEDIVFTETNRALLDKIDKQGILQSIASRNDPAVAKAQLEKLDILHYFLYPQLGFQSKVQSIQKIADLLNIKQDSIAFIDDSEFELQEVSFFSPEVQCFNVHNDWKSFLDIISSNCALTYETRNRRKMILMDQKKQIEEQSFLRSREEFLKSCNMRLLIRRAQDKDLERVKELSKRTNQFATFIGSESEAFYEKYMQSKQTHLLVAELEDRFGYYGIIGACFSQIESNRLLVDKFCMSCRVGGRGIGTILLYEVINKLSCLNDCTQILCRFLQTEKNRPMMILLKSLGFKKMISPVDTYQYKLHAPLSKRAFDWLTVEHN